MTKNVEEEKEEALSGLEVNGWREVVDLPVISEGKPWNITDLEGILRKSVENVAKQAIQDNNGKIYTTLSGGVDSSLCLAIITELFPSGTEIHTFTAGGSEKHPDIQFARIVSQLFNTTHHEIIVNQNEKRKVIKEFKVFYGDSPETEAMIKRGDINVWAVYQEIARLKAKSVIAHDGIDELMGGYWLHRQTAEGGKTQQEAVFKRFWQDLQSKHLEPLEKTAGHFGITVLFPYLQRNLVEYISRIPVDKRASFNSGKIPLKEIAQKYVWPKIVVDRKKRGFIDALMKK